MSMSTARMLVTSRSGGRRRSGGQGIVEGVCGSILFVAVFVLLVMLGVNAYVVMTVDTTLRLIAMESAKVREEYTFFLGQRRNDIDDNTARELSTNFAVALANAYGLAVTPSDVQFNDTRTAEQSGTRCSITLRQLQLPYGGGVFPLAVSREVAAVVARMNVPAPALIDLNVRGEGGSITLRLPGYGAYRPIQTATNSSGRFALTNPQHGLATNLPGTRMPGPIRFTHYYGVAATGTVQGPIQGNGTAYVNPQPLPPVAQRNIQVR